MCEAGKTEAAPSYVELEEQLARERAAREAAERERDIHLKDAAAVREERDGAKRWNQHYLAALNTAASAACRRGHPPPRDEVKS